MGKKEEFSLNIADAQVLANIKELVNTGIKSELLGTHAAFQAIKRDAEKFETLAPKSRKSLLETAGIRLKSIFRQAGVL